MSGEDTVGRVKDSPVTVRGGEATVRSLNSL